mgnify:CR=1 FL=1
MTDIDVNLLKEHGIPDTPEKITLHKIVSQQLGQLMERQTHWQASVDYINQAIECCRKLQEMGDS